MLYKKIVIKTSNFLKYLSGTKFILKYTDRADKMSNVKFQ